MSSDDYLDVREAVRMVAGGKIAGNAAKGYASDVAMKVTTDAVQLLGGYGYTEDFPLEHMMRDVKVTQIYEGTSQFQRIVTARRLLASAGPAA